MVYRYIHCTGHAFLPMNFRGKERVTCLRTSAWEAIYHTVQNGSQRFGEGGGEGGREGCLYKQ